MDRRIRSGARSRPAAERSARREAGPARQARIPEARGFAGSGRTSRRDRISLWNPRGLLRARGLSNVSKTSSSNRGSSQTMAMSGYVYNPVASTRTRMSLVNTWHGPFFSWFPVSRARLSLTSVCSQVAPAIANTSPRTYSLLKSARRSWAKYSSGVTKLFRTVDMTFPPGGIAGVESVSKSRILALHSPVSALLSPVLQKRLRLCRSLARGIELQELVQRGQCIVGFLVLVQTFGLI